jgi:hypothetical protein
MERDRTTPRMTFDLLFVDEATAAAVGSSELGRVACAWNVE